MWSGQETLASIDQAVQQVRTQVQELDAEIQRTSTRLVELRQAEAERYKHLAKMRLGQMVTAEIVAGFDDAEREVKKILAQREQALQDLQHQIDALQDRQKQLEAERNQQRQAVAQAAEQLDRAEATTQKRLQEDAQHQTQVQKAKAADAIAKQAAAKTESAEQDRIEKGKPYEDDSLFMYLWRRHYGTSEYRANFLVRLLDRWVARLCQYQDARPNYAMLQDLPVRLREHAEHMRNVANQEFAALTTLERAAVEADGLLAQRHSVQSAEHTVDQIDARIQQDEEGFRQLMAKRAAYAAGEDELFHTAMTTLTDQFEREGIVSLRRLAETTRTADDDRIVQELAQIDAQQHTLEDTLARHKQMHTRYLDRLQELEGVRNQFKRERYDDVHSTFTNTDLLSMVLTEFLRGTANTGDLWGTIRGHQRYRRIESDPGFGSGGFGRAGGTWHFPLPGGGSDNDGSSAGSGSGGMWRLPAPGDDGFDTGGTLEGSGGFRTGGGF